MIDLYQKNKENITYLENSVHKIFSLIEELIINELPEYEIKIYGSYSTKLALEWSDLDIVVNRKVGICDSLILKRLATLLSNQNWYNTIKFIETAYVPIIKLVSSNELGNIKVDITVQDDKHYGLKCVKLIEDFKKEYEALEYLVIFIKHILKKNDLNDPYTGGLSSYAVTLMVVSYLQKEQEKKYSDISIKGENLGKLLLGLFNFYSNFDEKKYCIFVKSKHDYLENKENYVPVRNNNYIFLGFYSRSRAYCYN